MYSEISFKILPDHAVGEYASSVEITITDTFGQQRQKQILGLIQKEEIYQMISAGEDVVIDQLFVEGFSLAEFREQNGLALDQEVELKNFSAKGAFFSSEEMVDFSHARFTGDSSCFDQSIFANCPFTFYHAIFETKTTSFNGVRFGAGTANFQYSEYHSKSVSFENAVFQTGDVSFVSSIFGNSKVSFKDVDFGKGMVDFHYSKFGDGNITFDKARFGGGEVSFKRVDFGHGKVDFKRVEFSEGLIDFSESEFKSGKVIFRSAKFSTGRILFEEVLAQSDFIFDNAEFSTGDVSFFLASVRNISFRLCQLNGHIDLRVTKAQKIDLSYTIVRDIIDLMPNDSCAVKIDEMNFSGMRNLGNLYIDWQQNKVKKLILSQAGTTKREKSQQFLILKETYHSTGRYADEDQAYVWYKRFELKADLEYAISKKKSNGLWAYPTAFFKWLLFDKIGLYATEPLRVLFSVTVIYTMFSLLYLILPLIGDTYIDTGGGEVLAGLNPVAKAFYYSAITFLTIGYGEYYPVGILRFFASIEGYVGVFLMGYFSVAFVRKVLR